LLRAQLLELIVVLARAEHTPEGDPQRHRPRLEHTLNLIHERYSEQLSLAALAASLSAKYTSVVTAFTAM